MDSQVSQLMSLPESLEDVRIKDLPSSSYYIADFISIEEEQILLNKINTAPKPRWKQLTHRRLQTWPSDLTKDTLLDSGLPSWLAEPIVSRLLSLPVTIANNMGHIFHDSPHSQPNHVLINEYLSGQGIMPHKDGAAYHPVVCTISLGSSLCLDIYGSNGDGTIESKPRWKILQEQRSLLITTDDLYSKFLHGIAEVKEDVNLSSATIANWDLLRSTDEIVRGRFDRQTRISLTYRDVIKVSKLGIKLAIFGRH